MFYNHIFFCERAWVNNTRGCNSKLQ